MNQKINNRKKHSNKNKSDTCVLRLYVAGDAPNSRLARKNLDTIIGKLNSDDYCIEIIDVLVDPKKALKDEILVTPTLIRLSPGPERRVIGNLSEYESVAYILGL